MNVLAEFLLCQFHLRYHTNMSREYSCAVWGEMRTSYKDKLSWKDSVQW